MSTSMKMAQAIADELNAREWSVPFTAVVRFRPLTRSEDLAEMRVSVVPVEDVDDEWEGRDMCGRSVAVDVGAQQLIAADATDDPKQHEQHIEQGGNVLALAQEIRDHFRGKHIANPAAACLRTESSPLYAPGQLAQYQIMTAPVRLHWTLLETDE